MGEGERDFPSILYDIVRIMPDLKSKKRFKGLTLIELLVALAIVVLIISSFFVGLTQIQKARDAKRKADLEKIKTALYDYYFDSSCFPEELPGCGDIFGSGSAAYLNEFPCDPKGGSYGYQIEEKECSQWFKILTNLENIKDPGIDKVGCRNGCGPECEYNYGLASTNIQVYEGCVAYYACPPGGGKEGECAEFEDPWISQCPRIFENDPTCGGIDCSLKANKCHDDRGKKIPE